MAEQEADWIIPAGPAGSGPQSPGLLREESVEKKPGRWT
tara:strand:+ start:828 stop:944 length:117 start_codon:yes stop_codon:yes gene_type:complete